MSTESRHCEATFSNVMEVFGDKLDELLGDPLLLDIPQHVTLDEVKSLTSLEHGQAMSIKICRADGDVLTVIVDQNATVADLKKAIKRGFVLQRERQGGNAVGVSWKYVWRAYWLVHNGQKLKENQQSLKEFGIRNRDEITFIKRLRK